MGRSGTGLGLYIVKNTVQDHSGGILLDSDKNGTAFELYFPATRDTFDAEPETLPVETLKGNSETILVIDDEPLQRDIASQILKSLGYSVETATSGEEAIQYLKRDSADLVLLDMIMAPGLNGRQTCEKILGRDPKQKIIIVSGFSAGSDVKAAIQSGAEGFIQKPYTVNTIANAVKEALS